MVSAPPSPAITSSPGVPTSVGVRPKQVTAGAVVDGDGDGDVVDVGVGELGAGVGFVADIAGLGMTDAAPVAPATPAAASVTTALAATAEITGREERFLGGGPLWCSILDGVAMDVRCCDGHSQGVPYL